MAMEKMARKSAEGLDYVQSKQEKFVVCCWEIWLDRNQAIFETETRSLENLLQHLELQLPETASLHRMKGIFKPQMTILVRWHLPPRGYIKFNVDGAAQGTAAAGGVCRNAEGLCNGTAYNYSLSSRTPGSMAGTSARMGDGLQEDDRGNRLRVGCSTNRAKRMLEPQCNITAQTNMNTKTHKSSSKTLAFFREAQNHNYD